MFELSLGDPACLVHLRSSVSQHRLECAKRRRVFGTPVSGIVGERQEVHIVAARCETFQFVKRPDLVALVRRIGDAMREKQ